MYMYQNSQLGETTLTYIITGPVGTLCFSIGTVVSLQRLAQAGSLMTKKGKSYAALRQIGKMLGTDFDSGEFPTKAQEMFIEANTLLQE